MRSLVSSLLEAQKQMVIDPLWKIVLTHNSTAYTYGKERIKHIEHTEAEHRQQAQVLLDNSDLALTDLALQGYKAVVSYGCVDEGNVEQYSPTAPLWVIAQQLYEGYPQKVCGLALGGLLDLLSADKAQSSYEPSAGDTRTVKDWLIEILNLTNTGSESTEEQTTADSDLSLREGLRYFAGQRLTISDRTVTKLAFRIKKVGSPHGNVTFSIYDVDEDAPLVDGDIIARKVWGDANSLSTDYAWYVATLDTPVQVDQEVRIVCEYQDGDASNYVDIAYNASSVKADEWLSHIYTGDWTDVDTYDAAYKYYYSATPVTGFSHCSPVSLVFDSEDSLIDTFQPQDSFMIYKGDTRLNIAKRLIGWTGCVMRVEDDGKLHIFVPTTSGTDYDYEYEFSEETAGKHTFFNKNYRKRVVIPNYESVKSREDDSPSYSGYAVDTESYALIPKKGTPLELRLASDAQATAIAEAKLERNKMDSERGSGVVPMNVGAEVYDYVNLKDAVDSNNRVGNIKWLKRVCDADSKTFELSFRFGSLAEVPTSIGIPPTATAVALQPSPSPVMDFTVLYDNMLLLQENINILWSNYSNVYDMLEMMDTYLRSQIEDATFRRLKVTVHLEIPSEAA